MVGSKHGLNVWILQSRVSATFTRVSHLTNSLLQMGGFEFVPQKVQGNIRETSDLRVRLLATSDSNERVKQDLVIIVRRFPCLQGSNHSHWSWILAPEACKIKYSGAIPSGYSVIYFDLFPQAPVSVLI